MVFSHYLLLGTAEQLLGLSKLGLAAAYPTLTKSFNCRAAMPSHRCQLDSSPPRQGTCYHDARAVPALARTGVFAELTTTTTVVGSCKRAVDRRPDWQETAWPQSRARPVLGRAPGWMGADRRMGLPMTVNCVRAEGVA